MPEYLAPGVCVEEVPSEVRRIEAVPTGIAAFVGRFRAGKFHKATRVPSAKQFEADFGGPDAACAASLAVHLFFENGGRDAYVVRVPKRASAKDLIGRANKKKTGLRALDEVDAFDILCIPRAAELRADGMRKVYAAAQAYCEERRAFLIIDVNADVDDPSGMFDSWVDNDDLRHRSAATYFPRLLVADPSDPDELLNVAPGGAMAGLYARTDRQRGVWKAPAGTGASLWGVKGLAYYADDAEIAMLNPAALNVIRHFTGAGNVAWGARTLVGNTDHDWRYVPVRRLALFIEESLYRGTQWVVFEPNDEPSWASLRLSVGNFLHHLWRQGAFVGDKPEEAYFVKCGVGVTMTQDDIDNGRLVWLVGFAPLKPAEFVVIQFTQST